MSLPLNLRFFPWPLHKPAVVKRDPYDISTWGPECGRGFVRDERFARAGDRVIKPGVRRNRVKRQRIT